MWCLSNVGISNQFAKGLSTWTDNRRFSLPIVSVLKPVGSKLENVKSRKMWSWDVYVTGGKIALESVIRGYKVPVL